MPEVVIVLPGIMGSELFDKNELIWPGSLSELMLPYKKMDSLLQPELRVGDIISSFSVSSQYKSLLDSLAKCGFNAAARLPTLFTCPYDWRKSNVLAAKLLSDRIQEVRKLHPGDLVINLVAHSMGGLVARYLLESGNYSEANCRGFAHVARLITMGTPHRGAPLALAAALGQIKRLFLNAKQVKQLADADGFSSLYELMPAAGEPFFWDSRPRQRLGVIDPFLAGNASILGLSAKNIVLARAFHSGLDTSRRPKQVEYFCFVGTRQETISYLRWDLAANSKPAAMLIPDGGDGTVPSWSASFPGMQQQAIGGDHGSIYKTPALLTTLGELLGAPGVLSSTLRPNLFRLSVKDEVVEIGSKVSLAVLANSFVSALDGEIVVYKVAASDGTPTPEVEVARLPLLYKGSPLEAFSIKIDAPQYAGVYEIELLSNGQMASEERAPFLVQRA